MVRIKIQKKIRNFGLIGFLTILLIIVLDFVTQEIIFFNQEVNIFLNKVNYLPIALILYLILKDIFEYWKTDIYSLKFHIKEPGMVYIEDYSLWISISESDNLSSIFLEEMRQLKNLEEFSIELDCRKKNLKCFLYAGSYRELKERLERSRAILDIILPNLKSLSAEDILKFFQNQRFVKMGKNYILQEGENFILANYYFNESKSNFSGSRIVLVSKYLKSEEKSLTQLYEKEEYKTSQKFKFLSYLIAFSKQGGNKGIWEAKSLKNARFNYLLSKEETITFEEGIQHFIIKLKMMNLNKNPYDSEKDRKTIQLKSDLELKKVPNIKLKKNSICYELCNLGQNLDLEISNKLEKCNRRKEYCQKLVKNEKLVKLIKIILDEEYKNEQITIISELQKHLSIHHLICLLAQYNKTENFIKDHSRFIMLLNLLLIQITNPSKNLLQNRNLKIETTSIT